MARPSVRRTRWTSKTENSSMSSNSKRLLQRRIMTVAESCVHKNQYLAQLAPPHFLSDGIRLIAERLPGPTGRRRSHLDSGLFAA